MPSRAFELPVFFALISAALIAGRGLGQNPESPKPPSADQPGQPATVPPAESNKPEPPPADATAVEPAIRGYCPVSYHTDGKALKGDPQHRVEYQGLVYFCADAEKKKLLEKDPEKYLPRIGGLCTVALGGPYENRFRGDPTVYAVIDGKLYFCSSERAKRSFDKRPQEYVKNAELLYLLPELEGACPVTLQKEGTAIRGAEEFKQTYRAKVYFLKDQAALDEFKKDPARYVPQFDGYCAYNASQGSLVAGSQGIFAVVEGRTYFFADLESRARCTADPSKCIPAARANWPKISKDAGKAPGGS